MQCLENLVGLRGYCEPQSPYAVYVNDFRMGTLRRWAETADSESVTGRDFFEKLRKEAAREVARDFINKVRFFQVKKVLSSEIDGIFYDDNYLPYRNTSVQIASNSGDPYFGVEIVGIEFFSKDTGSAKVVVRDSTSCEVEYPINVTCGLNRVDIRRTGRWFDISLISEDSLELCEVINPTTNSYSRVINWLGGYVIDCEPVCNGAGSCYHITYSKGRRLFRVLVNCICDPERIVCQYADHLKHATAWRLLALLMESARYKDDKNRIIRNSQEEALAYYTTIMGGVDPMTGYDIKAPKYWVELAAVINSINFKTSSRCFECRGTWEYKTQ